MRLDDSLSMWELSKSFNRLPHSPVISRMPRIQHVYRILCVPVIDYFSQYQDIRIKNCCVNPDTETSCGRIFYAVSYENDCNYALKLWSFGTLAAFFSNRLLDTDLVFTGIPFWYSNLLVVQILRTMDCRRSVHQTNFSALYDFSSCCVHRFLF